MATTNEKRRVAPPSSVDLERDETRLGQELDDAKRKRDAARKRLPAVIAQGDAEAITEMRRSIASLDREIVRRTEELAEQNEALAVARERERLTEAKRQHQEVAALIASVAAAVEEAHDAIETAGAKLQQAQADLGALDLKFMSLGLPVDQYLLRATLWGLADWLLWLSSGGRLGRQRSLDTAHQLRKSGAASLRKAAAEFKTLSLRRAQGLLRVADTDPEAA